MAYYGKKEGMSTFAKIMIAVSLFFVALIATIVITFGNTSSSTSTPKNFINNAVQFLKGGEVKTAPAVELENLKPVEQETTEDDVILTVFADYACPHCQTFDEETTETVNEMLEDGTITELHIAPVSYQPTPYALLGHNAILCIVDNEPQKAYTAHETMMKLGAEGGTDRTALIKAVGEAAGEPLTTETQRCIKNNTFLNYADQQNEAGQAGGYWPITDAGITGTPAVFINEQKYSGQPDAEVLKLAINWVKAGGNLAELENNPALAETLDMSDPANPVIRETSEEN